MKSILYFSADWCKPCQTFKPIVKAAVDQSVDLDLKFVDIDRNMDTAYSYRIRNVPTLIGLREGHEVTRHVGAMQEDDFHEWLNSF